MKGVLINGRQQDHISVLDRGFQYGDGLFETMVVGGGRVRALRVHLHRLQHGCERLKIAPVDFPALRDEICQFAAANEQAVLKLIVTRGPSKRGYRPPDQQLPTRVLWAEAMPEFPAANHEQGVAVRVCQTRLGRNPCLAGMKHLNRLESILARAEWSDQSIAEGLLKDTCGAIVSGTVTNLFIVRSGVLLTPRIDQCGVAGTKRASVLAAAGTAEIPAEETTLYEDSLYQADEIFLTNAVIGIWPVRSLGSQHWSVGPITRLLQDATALEQDPAAVERYVASPGKSSDNADH